MSEAKDDYSGGDKVNASEVNQISKNANDAGGFRDDKLAGETINGATLPVPVYQNTTDNEFYACDANDTDKLNFVGFGISDSTNGNPIDLQLNGIVRGFTGLDEGEKYYVQDAVGTIGKAKGIYEILVGRAISATELFIIKENREKTIGFVPPFYTYQIPFVIMTDTGSIWASSNSANWNTDSGASVYSVAIDYLATKLLGTVLASFYRFDLAKKTIITMPVLHNGCTLDANDCLVFGLSSVFGTESDAIDGTSNSQLIFFYDQDDGKLYAKSCNGTNEEHTEITGWSQSDSRALNIFRIEFDGNGGEARYYINNVLKATHTTYTPDAAADVYIKYSQKATNILRLGIPTVSLEI